MSEKKVADASGANSEPQLRTPMAAGGLTFDFPTKYSWSVAPVTVPAYIGLGYVAHWLTRQDGFFTSAVGKVLPKRDSATLVTALGLAYAVTWIVTATTSVIGQSSVAPGYSNKSPRHHKAKLTGVAHRLVASHQALVEIFPSFAAAAIAVLAVRSGRVAPSFTIGTGLVDKILLAFGLKFLVYPVAYAADVDTVRSVAHVFTVGTLGSVFAELATVVGSS